MTEVHSVVGVQVQVPGVQVLVYMVWKYLFIIPVKCLERESNVFCLKYNCRVEISRIDYVCVYFQSPNVHCLLKVISSLLAGKLVQCAL